MSLRAPNVRTAALLALIFGAGALTSGCDIRKKLFAGTAAASSTGTTTTTAATVKTTSATTSAVLDTEYDLSAAGAKFKGWTIKGPSGAKIMNGSDGARVVGGAPSFDVIVGLDKPDLGAKKKTFDAINKTGTSTVKVSTDTPTLLEWTFSTSGMTFYSFMEVETVGKTQVTCKNMNGVTSESSLAKAKEACKTIAKS